MSASHGLPHYLRPPRTHTADGTVRRVGLEVELGDLSLARTLDVLQSAVGGVAVQRSQAEGRVEGTRFGTFKVEFDSPMLRERSYLEPLTRLGITAESVTAQRLEHSLLRMASAVVPVEIVSPPIPWDTLHELDPLWPALRAAGAAGTSTSVMYAFGLHLNPEPAALTPATLLATLRSFLLLQDWIVARAQIDLSRRLAPFINSFPEAYRRLVLAADYDPDLDALVDDYLEHNPTRNRPLDMLPLFAHLGVEGMAKRVENWSLVKGRPAFHYRLPDSLVSNAGWSPALDWNRWVVVERLADTPELLAELAAAYLRTDDLPLRWQSIGWIGEIQRRLAPLLADLESGAD
jgi:Putative amidoligase enzyme